MIPSPDWIVGLSKENLCLDDCTWVENRVIDLYPWDVGTQSGLRYDSPDEPTVPRSPIQRITSSNPNNPASPFFDETSAPMKPAARLHLLKQREYRKPCPPGRMGPINNMNPSWSGIGGAFMPEQSYPESNMGIPGSIGIMNPGLGSYGNNQQGAFDSQPSNNYGSQNSYSYGEGIGQPTDTELYGQGQLGGGGGGAGGGYDPYANNMGGSNNQGYGSRFPATSERPTGEESGSFFGNLFSGGNARSDQENEEPDNSCQARYNNCQEQLMDKEPCRNLPSCDESRDYGQSFNPFREFRDDHALEGPSSYLYESDPNKYEKPAYPYDPSYRSDSAHAIEDQTRDRGDDIFDMMENSYMYGQEDPSGNVDRPRYSKLNALPQGYNQEHQNCQVTQWGAWSDCSSLCGTGHRTRRRRYTEHDKSSGCSEELDDQEPCVGQGPGCPNHNPSGTEYGFTNQQGFFNPMADMMCALTSWGEWSPCSTKCGSGTRMRTRLFKVPFVDNRRCDVSLFKKESCFGMEESCNLAETFMKPSRDYEMEAADQEAQFDLVSTQMNSPYYETTNGYDTYNDIDNEINIQSLDQISYGSPYSGVHNDDYMCSKEPDPGSCQGHFPRWHYDPQTEGCHEFSYSGCHGNRNNFVSYKRCMSMCASQFGSRNWDVQNPSPFGKLQALNSIKIDPNPRISIDCQMSAWSEWSECSKSCGIGWQTRTREIVLPPQGQGKPCPQKLERKKKCRKIPCPTDSRYWYRGSWRHMVSNDDLRRSGN
eukprot:maker-scaffold327_size205035-snap-gene-1.9 protein:Tk05413 transcript:maker-scaffold327_size205035-snap-gene-1.9-mRNA-1 annotation:"PREDICTED: spondin-1-like"